MVASGVASAKDDRPGAFGGELSGPGYLVNFARHPPPGWPWGSPRIGGCQAEFEVHTHLASMKASPFAQALAALCASSLASASFASIPAHQAQAGTCRAAFARERASATDPHARSDAARREEECLADADDGVLPLLARGAGESVDVPNAIQTYRDASAGFCGVLSEKGTDLEGPAQARTQCTANRESELAQLIDAYAQGGQAPSSVVTNLPICDEPFKGSHPGSDPAPWIALAACATDQVKTKSSLFVPRFADGDPLGTLSHSADQIASTFTTAINAGNGVCDALTATQPNARDLPRVRCRASIAANVAKAVVDRLR
jgi:hypothetical protein